jgi:glycosyltransferase involved in cell wall biosynthesis
LPDTEVVVKKIGYVLHRFPGITDTFIRREIRNLIGAGTDVTVISIWKPRASETTPEIASEWAARTRFVLPRSLWSMLGTSVATIFSQPRQFASAVRLAWSTSRPGIRGRTFQFFYLIEALLAAAIIRREGIHHLHNHIGDQSGTVTMLAASLSGIGYSITFHGWPVFFDAKYSYLKEKVQRARFTRCISYFCRSQLMMFSESDDPGPFKVVHCGVDVGRYQQKVPSNSVKTILCTARLSPEKGLAFLLGAFKDLSDRGYHLELRVAGDGPSRQRLEVLANDLGVSPNIHFLGFLSEDGIIRELRRADLFVLPSFVEGVPVAAMEAMAAGVPVIATNIAGTSELIEHGRTGLLVRPADVLALSNAVIEMIENRDLRRQVVYLAREKVEAEFDLDRETAKLNGFLLESCGP